MVGSTGYMSDATRFVRSLTLREGKSVRQMMKRHSSARTRVRAHAVLLSAKGYTINQICDILEVTRDSVSSWFSSFEEKGVEGLEEEPPSGRPRKIGSEGEARLRILVETDPRNVTAQFQEEYEKDSEDSISRGTVKRALRKLGFVWKRLRTSLSDKRDETAFHEAKQKLRDLRKRADRGEINLYYFDEAAFSLEPSVPYGWQPVGHTTKIPSTRSTKISVLGFLRHDGRRLHSTLLEGTVDAKAVGSCFDLFAKTVRKTTYVVLDNAPAHQSEEFLKKIAALTTRGIRCFFLPPYSPELNRIEILWRFVKNHWIPLDAYQSLQKLNASLMDIFANVGSRYRISFA